MITLEKLLSVNRNSIKYIDALSKKSGLHFLHAYNGVDGIDEYRKSFGYEKNFVCIINGCERNYYLDAWNNEYRIALEIDEPDHKEEDKSKYDFEREEELKSQHNIRMIRIPYSKGKGISQKNMRIALFKILYLKNKIIL